MINEGCVKKKYISRRKIAECLEQIMGIYAKYILSHLAHSLNLTYLGLLRKL